MLLLKLINNSSSLNKGNHDRDRFLQVFSLVLISIEKKYHTLKTVFGHISKHLKVHQKYSAVYRNFNSLLGVRKCSLTRSIEFDIFLTKQNTLENTVLIALTTGLITKDYTRLRSTIEYGYTL